MHFIEVNRLSSKIFNYNIYFLATDFLLAKLDLKFIIIMNFFISK